MTVTHIGRGGAWERERDIHAGRDGQWDRARVRLVAHEGRWLEAHTAEVEDHPLLGITSLSYRAGGPLQGALEVRGYGLTDVVLTDPPTGAFYSLRASFGDAFDNFDSLLPQGTEFPLPTVEDGAGAYRLDPSKQQYFKTSNTGEGRYDLLGFLVGGVDPEDCTWEMGGKFKPPVLPIGDEIVVLWYGQTSSDQFVRVWYNSAGELKYRYQYSAAQAWELTLAAAAVLDEWTGWSVRHRIQSGTNQRFFSMVLHDGRATEIGGTISTPNGLMFEYIFPMVGGVPDDTIQIDLGSGMGPPVVVPGTDWFRSGNTSAAFTIGGANAETLYWTGTAYRSAVPSKMMLPGTGKYYIEFLNNTSYDVHYGVVDSTFSLTGDNIQYGWIINTINGRIWAHTTGGGTNWTSAIPNNSVVSLVYDSDDGTLEVLVGGVSRGKPWPTGTITVPVQFSIGGRGQSASGPVNPLDVTCRPKSADWTHAPVGSSYQEMPHQDPSMSLNRAYGDVVIRDMYMRRDNNGVMSDLRRQAVIDPHLKLNLWFEPEGGGAPVLVNKYVLVMHLDGTYLVMAVPEVADGNYLIRAEYSTGGGLSRPHLFTVRNQVMRVDPLFVDFRNAGDTRQALMAGHKKWGGASGGISTDNIVINTQAGMAELTACGDLYSGPVLGVDRFGQPSGFNSRIGACLVTRDYFGPGRYRVVMRPLQVEGACNALWSFHYEESYPGSDLWVSHTEDGLHLSGSEELGYYTVRNHEIDIEFPTALKTDADQESVTFTHARFNTWVGELRNWGVPNSDVPTHDPMYSPVNDPSYWSEYTDDFVNHGVNLADGNWHELGYDWHLGDNPRVEFYIDGVLRHTVTTHVPDIPGRFWVGHWFPSAATHWAGRNASWDTQLMLVRSVSITPFEDEQADARNITETYPLDVYRDLKHIR